MNRGQVTLFVIIGLAILVIAGLVLIRPDGPAPSLESQQDAALVTSIVQQCLAQAGQESIRELSSRGGIHSITQLKDLPTPDTQVVNLPAQKVPLWHEVSSCKQSPVGCLNDHRPPLCAKDERVCPLQSKGDRSIQEGIELLTAAKLESCLGNFSSLPGITVIAGGEPKVDASIRENDVALLLNYPLTIDDGKGTAELEEFSASLDVNLPRIYSLAYGIQMEERSRAFVEEVFINLLAVYQSVDGPIPPFRDIQFMGSPKMWVAREVQQNIEEGILPFMDFIQIANAQNFVPLESADLGNYTPYASGIYEYMAINLGEGSYPLNVRMEHVADPVSVQINGGKPLLKPRRMPDTGILRLLGMNVYDYRFRYVVSFPIVVHIEDPAAFNGQGLDFSFGMEANIYNNRPLNLSETYASLDFTEPGLDLADPSQRTAHLFEIAVTDRYGGAPIQGATVMYSCGAEYPVGVTDARGLWRGNLPFCALGGNVAAYAEGYSSTGILLDNPEDDGSSRHEVKLWKVRTKQVKVFKLGHLDIGNITAGGDRATYRSGLGQNDSLVLQIARIKETQLDEDIPLISVFQLGGTGAGAAANAGLDDARAQLDALLQQGVITRADYDSLVRDIAQVQQQNQEAVRSTITDTFTLEVIPGAYNVDGTLMYVGLVQIPEKRTNDYTLPAQNFSSWVSGGVLLTGADAFNLTPQQVYGDGSIMIYVLEQKIPQTWDDVMQAQDLATYQSYGRRAAVRPEIS